MPPSPRQRMIIIIYHLAARIICDSQTQRQILQQWLLVTTLSVRIKAGIRFVNRENGAGAGADGGDSKAKSFQIVFNLYR